MPRPLIRDGKLAGNPLEMGYDLSRLNEKQTQSLQHIMQKSDQGKSLTSDEMLDLLSIRKAAHAGIPDPLADVRSMIGELKRATENLAGH